jgi:glycosyltransferase involved in cell wall biosynthesis
LSNDDVLLKTININGIIIQFGFLRYILDHDVKAIIFLGNPYILSNWIYSLTAIALGKKAIYWTHGWLGMEKGIRGSIRKSYYKLADSLLLYGQRAKKIGINLGFDPNTLHVIYNSLNYYIQCDIRDKLISSGARTASPATFLFVGRLTAEVHLDVAFRALAELKTQGINASLNVIGNGHMREALGKLARSLDVDVRFLGEIYDEEEIGKQMLAARAVVSPGKVGLLAMHALAYGTPVLTHGNFDKQMPEFEAIQDDITGGFFRQGDAADLARLMRVWLEKKPSTDASKAAIEMIEKNYTPSVQRKLIEDALSATLLDKR